MKRVCLVGVESTGKSTLAIKLAARFGGIVMPEFGRSWAEAHGLDFPPEALRTIAAGHIAQRTALEAQAPALIVEDTDIVMTGAWAVMLHGGRDPLLSAITATADLYLRFAADTGWVADGTRKFNGVERLQFDAVITAELAARGIDAVPIAGDWAAREAAATAAVAALMAG